MIRILNLGAGVQSTTIAIMGQLNHEAAARGEEQPYPSVGLIEFAIFGDTGDEPWSVYVHLCWLVQRCSSIRFLIRSIDRKRNRILKRLFPFAGPTHPRALRFLAWLRRIEAGALRGSLLRGDGGLMKQRGETGRIASIPAFTWDGKTVRMTRAGHVPDEGKTKRQCTSEWKIDCVERAIRREVFGLEPGKHMPRTPVVTQIFGLSFDEAGRIVKVRRNFQAINWAEPEFPLFDMEQTRGGCLAWLKKHGPPYRVVRSACTHCPLHGNEEWRELRDNDPASWEEAVGVDRRMREPGVYINRSLNEALFLHRSCKPLDQAPIDETDSRKLQEVMGFATACEGLCGT